ncbi:acyl-CoA dehydrogenase family member 10 [Plakobranchus ocellatus]|uniref:Acyl-CoA dehydrogenase family member 10 n=1 Tax=Plakobranchus ocellatus TaxID=259542 RepID=A0AAV3ZLT5_9GAST|nr:acyl-CoA dehydrogenase family member 10 [Plakobranchus ocellatus]
MLRAFRGTLLERQLISNRQNSHAKIMAKCFSSDGRPTRFKAVVFDMGGVVLPSPFQMFRDFEKSVGLKSGALAKIIVSEGSQGPWGQLEEGKLTLSQFSQLFSKTISKEVGNEVDVSPLINWMSYNNVDAFPEMVEAVQCVRAYGLKTALLTNNWFLDEKKMKTLLPVDTSLFDVVVESCVLGHRKPGPMMYSKCLQELKVSGDQVVFLDDIGINLKAAQEFGITTIKVNTASQAVSELSQVLGVPLDSPAPGTIPIPPRLKLDEERLENYLKSLGMVDTAKPLVRVFEHGQSNPTYFVSYAGRRLVLRKKPPGKLLPSAHAVDREFRVMSAMAKGGVPVPNMVAMCEDESILGTPFYLMDYIKGRVFKDTSLREVAFEQRRPIVMNMIKTLAKIHAVDIDGVGLSGYGKKGNRGYMARNLHRWVAQYEASKTREIPSMTQLIDWLSKRLPQEERIAVVHGDFRLDNLLYHPDTAEVLAAIDWELSTIGDPFSDLATCSVAYYLPQDSPLFAGLKGQDLAALGIPTPEELVQEYCRLSNLPGIDNWDFYLAYCFFRTAAILQGVYKRAVSGQSSSSDGEIVGQFAESMADIGWEIASKSSLKPTNPGPQPSNTSAGTSQQQQQQQRSFSTLSSPSRLRTHQPIMTALNIRSSTTSASSSSEQAGQMAVSLHGLSPRVQDLHSRVKKFIQEHVLPLEQVKVQRLSQPGVNRWQILPELEEAKARAKSEGLWNLFLPLESDPEAKYGAGLTNLEYAFLCEEMGKSIIASEVASSDATNIESSIRREGDHYIINGHKWWTSGALDPRCKICIFMGKTDTGAAKHRQQSMILVPMDTPGITIVRPLTVFGYDDAPEGHGEVIFENVRVPVSNILLGEGRGFEIAQGRLGPGRIHHCMRLIGSAERALELMIDRTMNRVAFGKPLAAQGSIQQDVARSRIEIEQCRLLVLKAAHMMDLYGNKVAAQEIAMIKIAAPNMAQKVIDRAIQAHGGGGLDQAFPLATHFAWARILRLADGPDEVHLQSLARSMYAKAKNAKI